MKKLFTTIVIMLLLVMFPAGAKAAEVDSEVSRTSTCTVNNITRSLTFYENGEVYLKVGNQEPLFITFNCVDAGLDMYGSVWTIKKLDTGIRWYNYEFLNLKLTFYPIPRPTDDNPYGYVDDVEFLVFDEKGLVIGYKTFSGETYSILTLEEMTEQFLSKNPGASIPTLVPSDTPTSTSTPEPTVAPTVAPTVIPTVVPTAVPTVEPTAVPTPEPMAKVSIKKKSGFTCLYSGNNLVHKYKLKKGVLTWTGKKTKKFKNIKYAGFIKKSQNVIFMTKSGKVYTLSKTGKKKLVVKNAKKFVCKAKFVVKVKTKTGTTNVSNR